MIRFGAIVSVVAIAMGLLIVGAIVGDLTLVYVSIALAAVALVMLIAGVAIWRDEIFGARSTSAAEPRATAAEPELVSASPRGVGATADPRARQAGATGSRSRGGASGPVRSPATRDDRPEGAEAGTGQSARRKGGDEAALPGSAAAARTSHRAGGRPEQERDQRGRDQRERDQHQRDQHQRDQHQRSQHDWSRPASGTDPAAASARPPAGAMGAAGAAARPGPADAGSASKPQSGHGQPGATRPLPGPPASVRPYAASAGGGSPSGATVRPRSASPSERSAKPDRAPPPASPFFTPASKGPADSATSRTGTPARDNQDQPASTATQARLAQGEARPAPGEASTRQAAPTQPASVPVSPKQARSAPAADRPAGGPVSAPPAAAGRAPSNSHAAPSSAAAAPSAKSDVNVSVVPGIARYHMADCILIRFLSDDDLETMTLQAAEKIGCIPCRACRPGATPKPD